MGRLTGPDVLAVDANCIIYLFESLASPRGRRVQAMLVAPAVSEVITSVLTIAEVLVKPMREGTEEEVSELREAILATPRLRIVEVDRRIAETAARIRATTGLKLPDAVHLAAAVAGGAQAFLTNDSGFKRASAFLPVLILDELIAGDATSGA
jgi:predicted nucleic acid-binding protein